MILRIFRAFHSNLTLYPDQPEVCVEKNHGCGIKGHRVNQNQISKKDTNFIKRVESDLTKRAPIFYRQEAVLVRFSTVNLTHFFFYCTRKILKVESTAEKNKIWNHILITYWTSWRVVPVPRTEELVACD